MCKFNFLFRVVGQVEMSTDGHLKFKNVLLFLQKQIQNIKQNREMGMQQGHCLSHCGRPQSSAD